MISGAICLASNVKLNTDFLRSQLDQLHSDAETTRRKANNARYRLLRLSEAAEKLRRQAARSLQMGKEDDARELLMQKKKVMTALEKSKGRVELLDELAAKLTEAISIKEAQLVENVGSDFETSNVDGESPVRIVSPMPDSMEEEDGGENISLNNSTVDKEGSIHDSENQGMIFSDSESEDTIAPEGFSDENEVSMFSSLRGISSYINLLESLDRKLCKIEDELFTILEVSSVLLEDQEKRNNSRLQQISEILESIRSTRARVQCFLQDTLKSR